MSYVRVRSIFVFDVVFENFYFEQSQKIVIYLIILRKFSKMTFKKFNKFKKNALKFKMQNDHLFRRNNKNVFLRRIIDSSEKRMRIIEFLHDKSEHRDREDIYRRIVDHYWWNNMYEKIKRYVKICETCQLRDSFKKKNALHSIWVFVLWEKIDLNIIYMSSNDEKSFLIMTRDDLSNWVKAKALSNNKFWKIIKFFWKNVICRHDCFEKLIVDDESKNKATINDLTIKYEIKRIVVSVYHFSTNEMIEKKHRLITNSLAKITKKSKKWIDNLHTMFWVDRIIVKFIIDVIFFYLNCDNDFIFSIELDIFIWRMLSWNIVRIIENLLIMRARQLQQKDENMKKTRNLLKRMREQKKKNFDVLHHTENKKIDVDDLILLHDTQHENDKNFNRKLNNRWRNLFRMKQTIIKKNTYFLKKFDEAQLTKTFAKNRLKKFHQK